VSGAVAPTNDPWTWLLGRTATGGWRHAPFRALDPGQGQDPSLEPRVEVIRRLIAYPPRAFATLVDAIRASDGDPRHPIQWCCHRSSGDAPARPYWISFLRPKDPSGRRFFVAIELFDRQALGLWFFSGFHEAGVPREARAPFPEQPRVALPRFEVRDESLAHGSYDVWIRLAFMDALRTFDASSHDAATIAPAQAQVVDQSCIIDGIPSASKSAQSATGLRSTGALARGMLAAGDEDEGPSVRTARARLVLCPPGKAPEVIPLARLALVIGRDPRCDLVLDDRSISSEHARIVFREGVPTIEDLGSKNGTRVGLEPVRKGQPPHVLGAECFVGLGKVSGYFGRHDDAPIPRGETRPARHVARLEELVARGTLRREQADRAIVEARARSLTPAEVLLADGVVSPETWAGVPKLSGSSGCVLVLVALLLLLVLFASGCQSMAIPPFYEQSIDEHVPMREGDREVTWEEDIGLRPIFDVRKTEKDDRTEVDWLFPFGSYERKGEDRRVRFYPFYLRDVRTDPDGFKHDTTVCFPPGLFAGTSPVHGDFVYLFPFGGNMYGLFGKDEIVGVLFPLYAWTEDRGVETHHILFPLIAWWSGGDEKATQEGWRFLPFYGHQKKVTADGVTIFDRTTVLWPFISWVHEEKNSRNPFDSIAIFPFWGRTRSGWRDEDTLLWPLFRYTHDKQTHYEEWRAPFPFFFYGQEDGTPGAVASSRFDVWPLFGVRTRGDSYYRQFVAWPFERYERQETDDYTDQRFWFVPFVYTMSRVSKKNPNAPSEPEWSARKTRIWPLVRYERTKEGDVEVHALCPLWFDDPLWNFETILDPLYRFFRYKEGHDGSHELDLLLGLYASRTKADGSSRWDVFGGLFGHATNPTGEGSTRLLWFVNL
jgi:hypothetical protein